MKSQELVFDDRMVDFSDSEFPAGEPCNGNLLAKENWAQLGSFLIGEDFNRPEV
jgi:K+-transporting ATPase c subunit